MKINLETRHADVNAVVQASTNRKLKFNEIKVEIDEFRNTAVDSDLDGPKDRVSWIEIQGTHKNMNVECISVDERYRGDRLPSIRTSTGFPSTIPEVGQPDMDELNRNG